MNERGTTVLPGDNLFVPARLLPIARGRGEERLGSTSARTRPLARETQTRELRPTPEDAAREPGRGARWPTHPPIAWLPSRGAEAALGLAQPGAIARVRATRLHMHMPHSPLSSPRWRPGSLESGSRMRGARAAHGLLTGTPATTAEQFAIPGPPCASPAWANGSEATRAQVRSGVAAAPRCLAPAHPHPDPRPCMTINIAFRARRGEADWVKCGRACAGRPQT